MKMENLRNITRRTFNTLAFGAAAGLILPGTSLAHHEGMKDVRAIPVTEDMTSNLVMDYIANQAGLSLGKHVTDDARKYMSVHLGEKSPQTVWVGVNVDDVVLSDQIAWKTKEESVAKFAKKIRINRTPDMVDYLFSGDSLILDLGKMSPEDKAKIIAKFGDPNINVTRDQLADFTTKNYGSHVEQQKAEIAKLPEVSVNRVGRYAKMDTLAFMVREVSSGVGDRMYKDLKDQGVTFSSPMEAVAKSKQLGPAVEGPNHKGDVAAEVKFYLGLAYNRPYGDGSPGNAKIGNIGITPLNPGIGNVYDIQILLSGKQIERIVGENDYRALMNKAVSQRTRVESDALRYFQRVNPANARKLLENTQVYDTTTGNVTRSITPAAFISEHGYTFRTALIQAVKGKSI